MDVFTAAFPTFTTTTEPLIYAFAREHPDLFAGDAVPPIPSTLFAYIHGFREREKVPYRLQRKLQAHINANPVRAFFRSSDPRERARIFSSSHTISSSAFGAFVSADGTVGPEISDSDFRIALSLRLGLPLAPSLPPSHCTLCDDCPSLAEDPGHPISCKGVLRTATSKRHNRIVTAIANFANHQAGCLVRKELTINLDSRKRPDLDFLTMDRLQQDFISDVEITRADCTSYVAQSSAVSGWAANSGAKTKIAKYQKLTKRPIIPLVFEAHGRPSDSALEAIKIIARAAEAMYPADKQRNVSAEVTRELFHVISVHLHRGNAAVARAYVAAVQRKDPAAADSVDDSLLDH